MTEKEVDDFIADYHHRVPVAEFEQRGLELERRLANEPLTLQQSADIMQLPVDVFRRLWGNHLTWQAIKQKMGTEH